MSQQFNKLIGLLKELFQLDQPDLDFGLYRIMHAKSEEITRFLDQDLLPQVRAAFADYQSADKAELEKELQELVSGIEKAGMDPNASPKVQELRQSIAENSVDIAALEAEVYDHLYRFFRRYYHEGDFLPKRVYKPGVYAIPYEGEEVKLHWANRDQYYIKSSEYLRDYAFTLKPGEADPMRVHFKLVDAAEGEHGNVKEAEGKERVFILAGTDFIAEEDGELTIYFEYRPATMADWPAEAKVEATAAAAKKPPQQDVLTADAVRRVFTTEDPAIAPWLAELRKRHVKANSEKVEYSRLEAHLNRYTKRHTFDYFIHKDLGGFLQRELDFYIKNEVMYLDDIEKETAPRVEQYLSKIKVIRQIADKLIAFLSQLENFQKRLWHKRKFVTETNYCITLNRIPEDFYPEIAANDAQRAEWVELMALDELEGYSEPLTVGFLKAHPTLMIDTRHFEDDWTARLLESFVNLEENIDGVAFHGDNFQALRLMEQKARESIDNIYIDPPYNAQSSEILYKNTYKHSSWLSLMENRMSIAARLLAPKGVFVSAIDEVEQERLGLLLREHFPSLHQSCIVVNSNPSGQQGDNFSFTHEFAYFMHPAPGRHIAEQERENSKDWDERNFRDVTGPESLREAGKSCFYPVIVKEGNIVGFGDVCEDSFHPHMNEEGPDGSVHVYPVDPQGIERKWRFARHTVSEIQEELRAHYLKNRGVYDIKRLKKKFNYKSNWLGARYSANNYGTQLLNQIIPSAPASYPKSLYTTRDCVHAALNERSNGTVLDYFAGSGTTAHSVIALNREDAGKRRIYLAENGPHFDSVLLPRLKKITFTPEWQGGKPKRLATEEEAARGPGVLKYHRLESYEDTLNNLAPARSKAQDDLLATPAAQGAERLREEYLLRYMLDVETRGSQSLLNIDAFADPMGYKLKIKQPGGEENREVNVDLIETFNWLIGLTVKHMSAPQSFTAEFTHTDDPDLPKDAPRRLELKGRLKRDANGPWWVRTMTGTTPDGQETLIIWRKLTGDAERDNLVLDAWFRAQGYSTRDTEFNLIYVNGDNNLENLRQPDETWKVRLIEEDFHHLMFDMQDA